MTDEKTTTETEKQTTTVEPTLPYPINGDTAFPQKETVETEKTTVEEES